MKKPHGRQTRQKVRHILMETDKNTALAQLALIPDNQRVGHFFACFYHKNELVKFRSIAAMGVLVQRMAACHMEKARVVLRRIMWNLNDESGGIGWGSPEAMGEILSQSPDLALEFKSILFSYLDPHGNYIEHEMLQRGVLWGIGTFLKAAPETLGDTTKDLLCNHLHSHDPVKQAYAVRALSHGGSLLDSLIPDSMKTDDQQVDIFDGWDFNPIRISDLVRGGKDHTMSE